MDRQIRFSGDACKFLNGNGFDFGKVFRLGVPYLSRAEEADLRATKGSGQNEEPSDILLKLGDPSFNFYQDVKGKIKDWIEDPKADDYLNISHPKDENTPMNGLQRRLIHQLLKKEYPTYGAEGMNRGSWMQVTKIDPTKEAKVC